VLRWLLSFFDFLRKKMQATPKTFAGKILIRSALALAAFSFNSAYAACSIPAPLSTIDPPGYYDDAAGYQQAVKPMRAFIDRLNKAAETEQWACVLDLLGGWAKADALMGPIAGYQGYYERSWAGTDFALVLLRVPADLRTSDPARWNAITAWLARIAIATRDAEAINHLHNNLVYWAGLNLVAIGTVSDSPDLFEAGLQRAREGINDIGPHGELQREIKRGDRALHYHVFSLLPLVFTAELAAQRHIDLYAENHGALKRLANLAIQAVQDPASFAAITPVAQKFFPWTFQDELAWMEPYYAHTRDPRLPALIAARRPISEWRLGGNVTQAWGVALDAGTAQR
jgi:poly(beta-D-mannuronate) lyase